MTFDEFAELVRASLYFCSKHAYGNEKPDANCMAIELLMRLRKVEADERARDTVAVSKALEKLVGPATPDEEPKP